MVSISVNGVTISASGQGVVIRDGKVIVDGKDVTPVDAKEISITVNGNVNKVEADACREIYVTGEVGNVKTLSGDVIVTGNVKGSVQTMSGDVACGGSVAGSVSTMSGDVKHRK
ncbi:MAG: hypothetical protein HYT62_00525 [Candidatus Yanofskybacteria bacterium]|nr:hypothetical protein [Candidatus Yanofskybacteria bacterium]